MIRAFVALDPGEEIRAGLSALRDELRETGADVRWTRPEGTHLTLRFLGDVEEAQVPEIVRALEEAAIGTKAIEIEVRGVGVFPNERRPRVVWAGADGDGLENLARAVDRALAPLGFTPEERPFRGHLTLGRVRSSRGAAELRRAIADAKDRAFGKARIDRVTLFRSDLHPKGARYSIVHETPLGAL